jgi:hypothetical protein
MQVCGRSPAEILCSNLTGGMDFLLCFVLSGRGLCDELITRPEDSCRLWRVVCDHENLVGEVIARAGLHNQKKICIYTRIYMYNIFI